MVVIGRERDRDAIAVELQYFRGIDRDGIEAGAHAGLARHLRNVQAHRRDFEHVAAAQRVPWIHHAVVAERNIDSRRHQFRNARHAAPFRIRVAASLQRDADQRIGDRVHAGLRHQRDQLCDVVVVHRMHRRQMRARHTLLKPEPLRVKRERLHVARMRIVGLVAMDVDQAVLFRRELADELHAFGAVGGGSLEVRNAADDIDAHRKRALQIVERAGAAQ